MPDLFKILRDLEYKAAGIDPQNNAMQEGYFVAFRNIGLPIPKDDFANAWTPTGGNLKEILSSRPAAGTGTPEGTDPANATPKSASKQLDENMIMAAGIGKSMQSYLNTFMLTDDKLVLSHTHNVMPKSSKVNDTWFAIVNGANAIASKLELNDEIKKAVEDAKALLMDKDGNPTPKFEAYNKYRDEYTSKVNIRNRQYANAFSNPMQLQQWPIQGKVFQDDVDYAWDQWQGFGFKVEVEKAMNTLAAQGIDPAILLIARAKHKYENSLVNFPNVGNIPYTFIIPNKWYSPDDFDGWTQYSETDFHSETHYKESSSSIKANASLNLGFWSTGGSFNSNTSRQEFQSKRSNLSIKFEFAVADIKRPWLDTTLLNLPNWFLVGDYAKNCISEGTFTQEQKATSSEATFLPSVVTSFILLRNLSITWDEASTEWDAMQSQISSGGSLGIGPICLSGSYSRGKKEHNFSCNLDGKTLHVNGVQLIGYVSSITPASPHVASKDYMVEKKKEQDKVKEKEPVTPQQ